MKSIVQEYKRGCTKMSPRITKDIIRYMYARIKGSRTIAFSPYGPCNEGQKGDDGAGEAGFDEGVRHACVEAAGCRQRVLEEIGV
jgi:hypothetical protein